MKRQKIRKLLLLISLLLFPVTIWYFSPVLILAGVARHIITGSCIVFALMFIGSLFFSRIFCAFLCPAGCLQECASLINDRRSKQGKRDFIKYIIWIIWISCIVAIFIRGKGPVKAEPFFMTDHGISIAEIRSYVIYYGILLIILLPPILAGKRAFCHYLCWMAPFMVLGSKLGRMLHLPQLHIHVERNKCVGCGICTGHCPMGLDAASFAKAGSFIHAECIQCGACVDSCPQHALHYSFRIVKGSHDGK